MGVSDGTSADVPSVFLKMVLGSFEIKNLGRKRGLRKKIEKKKQHMGEGEGIRNAECRRSKQKQDNFVEKQLLSINVGGTMSFSRRA